MARILVADDDRYVRTLLRHVIAGLGHDVAEAPDGRSALELHRARTADLAIVDLVMPEKEGIETITDLRAVTPDLPIIAMSGGGKGSAAVYLNHARVLGAHETVQKPFDVVALGELITALLTDEASASHV